MTVFNVLKDGKDFCNIILNYPNSASATTADIVPTEIEFLTQDIDAIGDFFYYVTTVPVLGAKRFLDVEKLYPDSIEKEQVDFQGWEAALKSLPSGWGYMVKSPPKIKASLIPLEGQELGCYL